MLLPRLRDLYRSLLQRRRAESDLENEMRDHLEQEIANNIRVGMPPEEARFAALRLIGSISLYKEECRDLRGIGFVENLARDLHYAIRMWINSPGFTLITLLMLALGIGGNTAIFSLLNAVALRPLPVRALSQLVVLHWRAQHPPRVAGFSSYGDCERAPGDTSGCSLPPPVFARMRSETSVFSAVTAVAGPARLAFSANGSPQMVQGELVSGNYFSTLGVVSALGRTLKPSDDNASASPVAVLSYAFWQKAFASDPAAVGRTIHLNNCPFIIVGIAEPSFTNLTPGKLQDLWLPIATGPRLKIRFAMDVSSGTRWWLTTVARLKPGVSLIQAQADANLIFRSESLYGSSPGFKKSDNPILRLIPAQEGLTGRRGFFSKILNVLMCAVVLVLLIVCANVSGLLLSRSAARQKEIAVRLALGAGNRRIFRQLITEGLLLSAAGGALGILFAYWGVKTLTALLSQRSEFPFVVVPDWRVPIFTLSITLFAGLLFAFAPALHSTRPDLMPMLKQAVSAILIPAPSVWSRFQSGNAVVIAQVALSTVVLVSAGLLVRTLENLRNINPGFDTRNILLFNVSPSESGYKDAQIRALYLRLKDRVAAIPGVVSVSYSSDALLSGSLWTEDVHIQGQADTKTAEVDTVAIGTDFFKTLRIPLLEGRVLSPADFARAAEPVPIAVNGAFVHQYFPAGNPIGNRVTQKEGPAPDSVMHTWEIVAVVGNTRYNDLRREIHPTVYIPLIAGGASFELRTAVDPETLIPSVREIVNQLDSSLPLSDFRTQSETIDDLLTQERVTAQLATFFGLLGLSLVCFGIYGLLSYEVTRRTRDIGIRMALGAESSSILRNFVGRAMKLILIGLAIGIAAGMALTRLLSSFLFGVTAADPLTFTIASLLLIAVALLASYIPARRATKVDPITSSRYQ